MYNILNNKKPGVVPNLHMFQIWFVPSSLKQLYPSLPLGHYLFALPMLVFSWDPWKFQVFTELARVCNQHG